MRLAIIPLDGHVLDDRSRFVHGTCPTRRQNGPRRKIHFASEINAIAATGRFCRKNSLSFLQKSCFTRAVPPHAEGRTRVVTNVGAGCGGRVGLQREFFAPTNIPTRTVKSCGPGLPVLRPSRRQRLRVAHAMMFRITRTTGAIKPVPEESAYKPSNIAQGMPDDPAPPVVPAASFLSCWRAMGEAFTRHSLRPLVLEGG